MRSVASNVVLALGLLIAPMAPALISPAAALARSDYRYVLGTGDRLKMAVFKVPGYEASVEVLADGTITLPRLGSVPVAGLTLDQAKNNITRGYAAILRRPIVYLDLVYARPIRITVSGEVQRPGLYSLSRSESNSLESGGPNSSGSGTVIQTSGWPTLVEAIQKAGGLTSRGDLRKVTIRRLAPGGRSEQELRFNFWDSIKHGRRVQNPLLQDGDVILIPAADQISEADLITLGSSTFAPDTIAVTVLGEVTSPGPVKIKANSPLAAAIHAAGGVDEQRAKLSNLQLLRLEPNGSITEKRLAFSSTAPMGSDQNPPLRDGDVVVVDRHGWARTTDSLKNTVAPVGPLLNAASLFRVLGLGF